ncbi:MAG: hydrogenase maturation protease [Chromatiales bacterium]|nr:hydrogenase maturation protease [Chromatiales bacterium]
MDEAAPGALRLVIGLGNRDRGDDAAGLLVAEALRSQLPPDVRVFSGGNDPAALVGQLTGAEAAWIVDAASGQAAAGTVTRFDVSEAALPALHRTVSSHGLGLPAALELARSLGQLPRRCIVYTVAAQDFAPGSPLSPPVAAALPGLVRRLAAELDPVAVSAGDA